MADNEKIVRQLNLMALLLSEPEPLTFAQIQERMEQYGGAYDAAIRMFERDKSELKQLGVPLQTCAEDALLECDNAYRIDRRRYVLPMFRASPDEIFLLQVLAGAVREAASLPYIRSLSSALFKLSCRVGFDLVHDADEEAPMALNWEPVESARTKDMDLLTDAVRRRKTCYFSYTSAWSGACMDRCVNPYGMICRGSVWYMVGHCHTRKDVRVFRLSRMQNPRMNARAPGKPDYDIPDDFELRRHAGGPPWAYGEGECARVTVQFSPEALWRAGETMRDASVSPDASNQRAFDVMDPERFCLWLLTLGPGAKVLSPPKVRDLHARQAMALREQYRDREAPCA